MSGSFTHQVLPYRDVDDFLAGAIPFLRAGVDAGDEVLAVAGEPNLSLLRERLEETAGKVEFVEAASWYEHPARTLASCLARAEELAAEGRRLRMVGEPVWAGRSELEVTEWQRIEAIVNVAFAGTGTALLCPYDLRSLPPSIVAGGRHTHPETVKGIARTRNPGYMDPWAFNALCDQAPLPPPPESAQFLEIEVPNLYWLRAYVAEYAERFEMAEEETQRLLVAVTEVVTNAVRHGAPPIELRLWTEPPWQMVCEVRDAGHWRPAHGCGLVPGRFGLWAVRLLCSIVQVRTGPGTIVRLRLPLGF